MKIDIENEFYLIKRNSLTFALTATSMLLGVYAQLPGDTPNITITTIMGAIGLFSVWAAFFTTTSGSKKIRRSLEHNI